MINDIFLFGIDLHCTIIQGILIMAKLFCSQPTARLLLLGNHINTLKIHCYSAHTCISSLVNQTVKGSTINHRVGRQHNLCQNIAGYYCVPYRYVCDDVYDCPYGNDEAGCTNRTCTGNVFFISRHPKVIIL